MAKSGETSIWKKEITLRRKPKPAAAVQPESPKPAAAEAEPPKQETSIWKKEITLRRKRTPQPPVKAVPYRPPSGPPPATRPAQAPIPTGGAMSLPPVAPAPAQPPVAPPHAVASPVAPPAPQTAPAPAVEPRQAPAAPPRPAARPAPPPQRDEMAPTQVLPPAVPRADAPAKRPRKQPKPAGRKHKRVVGLKVGASQIAAAYVVNAGAPRLVRVARAPLPPGVVVAGELRDPEALAVALKAFFRKHKLPTTSVRLGVSNNRIGVRTFEIAGIDDETQLANAIRFRAQETLPIPLAEAVMDYRILDDWVGTDGVRVRRVLIVVAHRELVERYVTACRKAGLKLLGIDLEAFALLRAVSEPQALEDAAVVCVAVGHERSTLAVSDGNVCEFTRVLAWGGSALDLALARVLDLPPAAVESLKHELVPGEEGEAAGLDAERAARARQAMVVELRSFARELVGSLRFYQEQPGSLGIAEIVITGGTSAAGWFADELAHLIGIPVRVADPFKRVRTPRKLRRPASSGGSLAVAVGLGIED